jgi:hypothetical protein
MKESSDLPGYNNDNKATRVQYSAIAGQRWKGEARGMAGSFGLQNELFEIGRDILGVLIVWVISA